MQTQAAHRGFAAIGCYSSRAVVTPPRIGDRAAPLLRGWTITARLVPPAMLATRLQKARMEQFSDDDSCRRAICGQRRIRNLRRRQPQ